MKFTDLRGQLPQHPDRRYGSRDVGQLLGTCDHHTGGKSHRGSAGEYDTHQLIAIDHSAATSHLKEGGAPGIAYTYVIEPDGTIIECWDLTVKTWSQGFRDRKGDENAQFVAINHVGSFYSKHNKSGTRPTQAQMLSSLALHLHLTGSIQDPRIPARLFDAVPYGPADRTCHRALGKLACPGDDVAMLSEIAQAHKVQRTAHAWQVRLVALGYDIGRSGADGIWGPASERGLLSFCDDNQISADDRSKVWDTLDRIYREV